MQELFENSNGDFDIQKTHINDLGDYVITAGLSNNGILGKTDIKAKIFNANTITIDMFGNAFYRQFRYKMVTHARVFSLKFILSITQRQGIFLSSAMHFLKYNFGYENMCSWAKIKQEKISLPVKKDREIDFAFMEDFISQLEACRLSQLEACRLSQLEAYLLVTGLKNYTLTPAEEQALIDFQNGKVKWGEFNLENLYGKSTRGKRLKSADRINGDLPFVTAGEAETGVSAFIGNDVEIFAANTTTIDMFGSAKYRNYEYGGDDHIAVVHTEKINKYAAIFVTTAIHKSSYTGKFSYSRNFYAKDADELNIYLPTTNNIPDYSMMEILISAVQKLVIKDVVEYADRKIEATKKIINK